MRVLGDRVLVALPPVVDEITTASGLVLVKDPDRFHTPTRGIVVALGEKLGTVDLADVLATLDEQERADEWMYDEIVRAVSSLASAPFDVQLDDCVLFPASAGEEIEEDGIRYVILRESDILGVLEKETAA